MNELSLYIVLSVILAQGLFLLITIQFLPNKNKQANSILSIILLIANWMLLARMLIATEYELQTLWRIAVLIDGTILIFGPLLYCYIRRLLFKETTVFRLKIIHYAPAILYVFYFLWTLTQTFSSFFNPKESAAVRFDFLLIELAGIISMSFYIVKCFSMLRSSKRKQKDQYASDSKISTFLRVMLTALSIFCSLWLVSFINAYIFNIYFQYLTYNNLWISIGGIIYVIGFYSLTHHEIFRVAKSKGKTKRVDRLTHQEIELIKEKLQMKLDQKQFYLDSTIDLKSLAKSIGTTSNNLSWFLNNVYEKTFYEFINEYRIKAFLELIHENKHKTTTLFALAMDVGFNSKSTFNKAFKSLLGETPREFIKEIERGREQVKKKRA